LRIGSRGRRRRGPCAATRPVPSSGPRPSRDPPCIGSRQSDEDHAVAVRVNGRPIYTRLGTFSSVEPPRPRLTATLTENATGDRVRVRGPAKLRKSRGPLTLPRTVVGSKPAGLVGLSRPGADPHSRRTQIPSVARRGGAGGRTTLPGPRTGHADVLAGGFRASAASLRTDAAAGGLRLRRTMRTRGLRGFAAEPAASRH
jgi:hypothetical protein